MTTKEKIRIHIQIEQENRRKLKEWKERRKCKPLKRHWWRVQTEEDDAVYGDIGNECVKKLT